MKKGFLYFVQPVILFGTNRYKIGITTKYDKSRFIEYGSKTKIIYYIECNNIDLIERALIINFRKKFKNIKGNEYFEGNVEEMKNIFLKTYNFYKDKDRNFIKIRNTENDLKNKNKNENENDLYFNLKKCIISRLNILQELNQNYVNNYDKYYALQILLKIMNKNFSWEMSFTQIDIRNNEYKLQDWVQKYRILFGLSKSKGKNPITYLTSCVKKIISDWLSIKYKQKKIMKNKKRYYEYKLINIGIS